MNILELTLITIFIMVVGLYLIIELIDSFFRIRSYFKRSPFSEYDQKIGLSYNPKTKKLT